MYGLKMSAMSQKILVLVTNMLLIIHMTKNRNHVEHFITEDVEEMEIALKHKTSVRLYVQENQVIFREES